MSTQNSQSKQSVESLRAALRGAQAVVEQLERDLRVAEEAVATEAVLAMVEASGVSISDVSIPAEPVPFFGLECLVGPSDWSQKVFLPGVDGFGEFAGSCSGYLRAQVDASSPSGYVWCAFLYFHGYLIGYLGSSPSFREAAGFLRDAHASWSSGRLACAA